MIIRGSKRILTQQRIMSQITSMGASVFIPNGFTCVPDIRYPAFSTADRNITADGEVHFSVAQRLCRLKNRGTSGNSCKIGLWDQEQTHKIDHLHKTRISQTIHYFIITKAHNSISLFNANMGTHIITKACMVFH